MRLVTWNCRRATGTSAAWDYLLELQPDSALLQEVSGIPASVQSTYDCAFRKARGKTGNEQRFGTAILVSGPIVEERTLHSALDWGDRELDHVGGNVLSCEVSLRGRCVLAISVYSPPWHINPDRLANVHTDDGPRGNGEYLERMKSLRLTECLRHSSGALLPTLRNMRGGRSVHQMDLLFVSDHLSGDIEHCVTCRYEDVFEAALSDHVPIIADSLGHPGASEQTRKAAGQ